jgi:hypothetical protein
MAWTVTVAKPAQKQTARFPAKDQAKIGAAIRSVAADPFAGDVLKLEGEDDLWRPRTGSYRIEPDCFLMLIPPLRAKPTQQALPLPKSHPYLDHPEIILEPIWALPDRTRHALSDAENSSAPAAPAAHARSTRSTETARLLC